MSVFNERRSSRRKKELCAINLRCTWFGWFSSYSRGLSALDAGYLDVIDVSRLPKEFAPHFDKLKRIEPYVDTYRFGPWRLDIPKEKIAEQIEEIDDRDSAISRKDHEKELFLCLGLIGYFGHNLDMPGYG
ncbi:MAG: hypothetical protein ABSC19_03170, partial [Syntrophorhabdales bacterium]